MCRKQYILSMHSLKDMKMKDEKKFDTLQSGHGSASIITNDMSIQVFVTEILLLSN